MSGTQGPGLGLPGVQDTGYTPPPGYGHNPGYNHSVIGQPQMTQQPTQSTVVVTQQNTVVIGQRPWNSGVCDCCNNCGICLCVTLCAQCYACSLSSEMGEGFCLPCCCGPPAMTNLRVKLRIQENIEGSIWDDNCVMNCCYPCGLCQLGREWEMVKHQRAGQQMAATATHATHVITTPGVM